MFIEAHINFDQVVSVKESLFTKYAWFKINCVCSIKTTDVKIT